MNIQGNTFILNKSQRVVLNILLAVVGLPAAAAAVYAVMKGNGLATAILVIFLILWSYIIRKVSASSIVIHDDHLQKQILFPKKIKFDEVKKISFATKWSDFYLQTDNGKFYVDKGFENSDELKQLIINKVQEKKGLSEVELAGTAEQIERFASS